jgi:hypothetical protein
MNAGQFCLGTVDGVSDVGYIIALSVGLPQTT